MAKPKLSKSQRTLFAEVKRIISTLRLDPDEIVSDSPPEARTTHLELAKNQIIRSEIIMKYVLIDEQLGAIVCWYYFGKKRSFQQLWRTKRFASFNHFILDRIYLLQKLEIVRQIHDIPKWVASDISALNELRNGIAHSFFPENRRRKPEWKGTSVFTMAGFDRFMEDMGKLTDFFFEKFWGATPNETNGTQVSDAPESEGDDN